MKRAQKDINNPEEGENGQSSKRQKQRGSVKFNEDPEVREFDNEQDGVVKDSESGDLVGARIVGEKITSVEGEEDAGEWSDDDEQEIAIEPFNLKQEQEEGYFDVTGHYVENKFSKGVSDAWLDEYDEKWAKKMRGKQDTKPRQKDEEEESKVDKAGLKSKLITYLVEGENVLSALRRYSGKGSNKSERNMTKFNELTELADTLLSEGDSRERIVAEMREDEAHQPNPISGASGQDAILWEYKLKDGTTFGPYTTQNMADWSREGYFSAESGALVRQVKKTEESLFEDEYNENDNENEFVPSHTIDFTTFIR